MSDFEQTRLIVVPIIRDSADRILLCRMANDRGVFPGQWALSGGGVESGETIRAALDRELREELGIAVRSASPLFFKDAVYEKTFADGTRRPIYMVFLLYDCRVDDVTIRLNDEFAEFAWATIDSLGSYDLNVATIETFRQLGFLP